MTGEGDGDRDGARALDLRLGRSEPEIHLSW